MKSLNKNFRLAVMSTFCAILLMLTGSVNAQLNVQDIGEVISPDAAQEWMANFEFENPDNIFGHLYGKQTLQEILSQEGAVGLKIFNGMDENGAAKLVYYAANASGSKFGQAYDFSQPCPPFCDDPDDDQFSDTQEVENIGGPIEETLAAQWINDHQANQPSQIQSAMYGSQIVNTMLDANNVSGLFFAQAIDLDGQSQILLVAVDENGTLLMNHEVAGNPSTTPGAVLSASK